MAATHFPSFATGLIRKRVRGNVTHVTATPSTTPAPLDVASLLKTLAQAISDREDSGDVKGASVRAPEKFTGKDRTKYQTFIAQLRLVFRANSRRFASETNQVTYACSYLDDLVFSWYENYVAKGLEPEWFHNFAAFERELASQFGTINASAIAERKIQTLKMRPNDNINEYSWMSSSSFTSMISSSTPTTKRSTKLTSRKSSHNHTRVVRQIFEMRIPHEGSGIPRVQSHS